MTLVAVILTFNEAQHLGRCISSLRGVADEVVVVDSQSTDSTLEVAQHHGARVIQHPWVNHATQFNWALTQLDAGTNWVLRIDADEYLTSELATELQIRLPIVGGDVEGIYLRRRMNFQGTPIRHGGLFATPVLRLFRFGRGQCESRWMDEHIRVAGKTVIFEGFLIDDNLGTLTWWTTKHNNYASLEATELLNMEYSFMPRDSIATLQSGRRPEGKRWVKEVIYARMPPGFRALVYFLYRYVIRLGFLDGGSGSTFHVLQGFWYRYLVDAKVAEVKRYMRANGCGAPEAIERVLGVRV